MCFFAMLSSAEVDIKKEDQLLIIDQTTGFKKVKVKKVYFKKIGNYVATQGGKHVAAFFKPKDLSCIQ